MTNLRRDYNDFFSTKKIQHGSKVSNPVKTRLRSLGLTILPVWDENSEPSLPLTRPTSITLRRHLLIFILSLPI